MVIRRAHLHVIYCSMSLRLLFLLVYLRAVSFTRKAVAPFHRPSQPFRCALWSLDYRVKTHTPYLAHSHTQTHMDEWHLCTVLLFQFITVWLTRLSVHARVQLWRALLWTNLCNKLSFSLETDQCDRVIVLSIMLIQNELYSGDLKNISYSGRHFNYVLNSCWCLRRWGCLEKHITSLSGLLVHLVHSLGLKCCHKSLPALLHYCVILI